MPIPPVQILVVDDDAVLLGVLEESLKGGGEYEVHTAGTAAEAEARLASRAFDIVVSDYALGDAGRNGLTLLRRARELHPSTLGILITAFASLEISLDAIHLGAYDLLTKPFQLEELLVTVRNASERVRLERENERLRVQVADLADSLLRIGDAHADLLNRLRALIECSPQLVTLTPGGGLSRSNLGPQVETYLQLGQLIAEQLEHENQRLERLHRQGLIPEPVYRRELELRDSPPGD